MATVSVARSAHAVLTANVADSVQFLAVYQSVTVVNRGDDFLFVTTDGTTPTVHGTDTLVLPPSTTGSFPVLSPTSGTVPLITTVGLIAATNVPYSVSVSPVTVTSLGGGGTVSASGTSGYQTLEQVQALIAASLAGLGSTSGGAPLPHAASHAVGGTDPVTPAAIGAVPASALGAANGVATLDASQVNAQDPKAHTHPTPVLLCE